nr:MAG TPA: endonuclease-like protein [Ackermannviridae sp.]
MKVTDDIVKEEFKSKRYVYNPNTLRKYINKIEGKYNKDIYDYLINRYTDSDSLKETLYRIYNGIEEHPKCPTCGKPLIFKGIFFKFCSNICAQSSDEIKQKVKQTCLKKYGVDSYNKTKECKEKVKQTCLKKYGVEYSWQSNECKEKIRQTCLERYGVDNSLKSEKIRNKGKQTCLERYGVDNPAKLEKNKEKVKQTCLERYGGIAPIYDSNIKNKIKQTCLEKYGVDNYGKSLKHKINMSTIMSSNEMQEHRYGVMTKNHSFNTSKEEDEVYEFLSQYIDVTRQFNISSRYPFNCDFYIEDLDMFIECNFHWTHGGHPFDKNSIADQVKVQRWKSKKTKYYDNAIETWLVRDVKKRDKAKEENINYFEFWSLKELKKFFIDYFEN